MKKNAFDDDLQFLKKTNVHERRNSARADRKTSKKNLSEFTCLSDCYDEDDFDQDSKYYDDVSDLDFDEEF